MKEGDFVITPDGEKMRVSHVDDAPVWVRDRLGELRYFLRSELQEQPPSLVIVLDGGTIRSVAATVPGLACTYGVLWLRAEC